MCDVSVVMPVYNASKYLPMAMKSLINQTLKDIEIICVDDGSTDNSLEILKEYQLLDNRIHILKQKNKYAGIARNYGMKIAKGKYIIFLDADDCFHPEMLKSAFEVAENHQSDVVIFGGKTFEDDVNHTKSNTVCLKQDLLTENDTYNNLYVSRYKVTTTAPWNKLFRLEFIKNSKLKFQGLKKANDVYFVLMALALAKKVSYLRQELVYYRVGNTNSLQGSKDDSSFLFLEAYYTVKSELEKLGLYKKYRVDLLNRVVLQCIWNLESVEEVAIFEGNFLNIQSKYIELFDMYDLKSSDFENEIEFKKYQILLKGTALEYLMYLHKISKDKTRADYLFPFHKIPQGASIILYGAGVVGCTYKEQLLKTEYCMIRAWVDERVRMRDNYWIRRPKNVEWNNAYVVIAIESEKIAEMIMDTLVVEYGVKKDLIIWK